MRAYTIDSYLKDVTKELPGRLIEKAPEPAPKKSDVIVEVHSASLNFFDILQVQGKYQTQPPFPWVPGFEFAGVIAHDSPIPKGCSYKPGDRVFGGAQGAYAERVAADWRQLIEIPEGLNYDQASGLFITYPTSYLALAIRAQLQEDEWVLVHAGAGGVGLAAIQIAKALGAKVIATAGSEEKLKVSKELGGADYAVNYRDEKQWQKQVKEITGGKGVDVVYDPIGIIIPSLKVVNWNARILVVGFAAGQIEKVPSNLLLLKHASLIGVFWGGSASRQPDLVTETWMGLLQMLGEGKLKPAICKTYPLDQLAQGLDDLANRRTYGKAVLKIKDSKDSKL